jgi:alpha-glucosidase
MSEQNLLWWQSGVIYQIYPRSYKDSNGDGLGDLRGIIEKMDYLAYTLGVDAFWLSPYYKSPMADFGYDVADYTDVDAMFGTLADFEELIAAAHQRGMKVVVDFVPNHSSNLHPWFIQSRSSRTNNKADWYVWRDPKNGAEPNNWRAVFGGPAWTYEPKRGQYYLHSFLPDQPDLNWRNPDVKAAMFDAMRFWMRKGVDGFRVDVAHFLMKDPDYRDNPPAPAKPTNTDEAYKSFGEYDLQDHLYDKGHADNHALYREFRAVLNEFEDLSPRYSVGEIHIFDWKEWATYYGDNDELHMPFNFALIGSKWEAPKVRSVVESVEGVLTKGQWPNYVFSNHDEHRISSRYGAQAARSIMLVLLTLRGTPTMYYGDELGMTDGMIPPGMEQDPWGKRMPGLGLGRDPERTPMQWDATENAGFARAGVKPWLPVAEDYQRTNVAVELEDPHSMLNLTRALLTLRRMAPALHTGSYRTVTGVPDDTFVYVRQAEDERFLIAVNFSDENRTITAPELVMGNVAISTLMDRTEATTGRLDLRPHEGCIVKLV